MRTESSRRHFLKTLGVGVTGAAVARWSRGKALAGQRQPNIIFLLTDDQRWDTLGCLGNKVVQSPNLDRLAARGTVFDNCFASTPVCGPCRASILTGQHARRHGVADIEKLMDPGPWERTYPALLKKHGYFTGYIGKFNVGSADEVALWGSRYDYWAGWKYHGNYWHERNCPNVTNNGISEKTKNICTCPPEGEWPRVGHKGMKDPIHTTTEMEAIKVREFLDSRDGNMPFCLGIGMKAPKDPWDDFPPELAGLYEGVEMPIPITATPEMAANVPEFLQKSLASDTGLRYLKNREELSTRIRYYFRLVTALDSTVGKICEMLRQRGLADNTVIIFMSDNGHFLGDHGFWGKWTGYEPSIRVPCIVFDPRLPEAQQGKRRSEMVLNIDIAPTILSLAGIPIPDSVQGADMTPLIQGRNVAWRDSWFFEHSWTADGRIEPSEGVRTKRWKYLRYPRQEPAYEQLFDLSSDPHETQNLAGQKEYGSVLGAMRESCEGYRNSVL